MEEKIEKYANEVIDGINSLPELERVQVLQKVTEGVITQFKTDRDEAMAFAEKQANCLTDLDKFIRL